MHIRIHIRVQTYGKVPFQWINQKTHPANENEQWNIIMVNMLHTASQCEKYTTKTGTTNIEGRGR